MATSCKHKDKFIDSIHSAGVVLKLSQTKFNVTVFVSNITLVKNKKYNTGLEGGGIIDNFSIQHLYSMEFQNSTSCTILAGGVVHCHSIKVQNFYF